MCSLGYMDANGGRCNACTVNRYDSDPGAPLICATCSSAMTHCSTCTTSTLCGTCDIGYTGNTCTSCSPGFYDSSNGGTLQCDACASRCQTCSSSGCSVCFAGYRDTNIGDSVITCDGCAIGYYQVAAGPPINCAACIAHCDVCPDSTTCTTCDTEYTGPTCNLCATGHYRTAGGLCAQCTADVNGQCL